MWGIQTKDDTNSKETWHTVDGGGVRATAAGGQVTGFRAGHMMPGFTGGLIIDDPVKPKDANSDVMREAINKDFNETARSRLAVETVPIIVIMQRIHSEDLSGHLLMGGSGEKWHHLNLPVKIDNREKYPEEYTHGIEIPHGLPDGWLWDAKHNDEHEDQLKAARRVYAAQYMQRPIKDDELGPLWNNALIKQAKAKAEPWKLKRRVVAIDPSVSNNADSDECGLVVASAYTDGTYKVEIDASAIMKTSEWAKKAIELYDQTGADAIVAEVNNGGDLVEDALRLREFKGRYVGVRASRGKYSRAEPVAALYELGLVKHAAGLGELENQMTTYNPKTAKRSPDRLDAGVWALTELAGLGESNQDAGVFSW
jgi:phage terminase large subunit-like protein